MYPTFVVAALALIIRLCDAGVPYEPRALFEGWQLRFPWTRGDVACHLGTYGHANGFVETYQFPWDEGGVSMLTPEECANKIIAYYTKQTSGFDISP